MRVSIRGSTCVDKVWLQLASVWCRLQSFYGSVIFVRVTLQTRRASFREEGLRSLSLLVRIPGSGAFHCLLPAMCSHPLEHSRRRRCSRRLGSSIIPWMVSTRRRQLWVGTHPEPLPWRTSASTRSTGALECLSLSTGPWLLSLSPGPRPGSLRFVRV